MQTARAQQIIFPHVTTTDDNVRWFSAVGCVVYRPDEAEVSVGATLVGTFGSKDVGLRNLLFMTHALGLHAAIIERSSKARSFRQRLRVVIDSVIIAHQSRQAPADLFDECAAQPFRAQLSEYAANIYYGATASLSW